MIHIEVKKVERENITGFTCDKCGKKFNSGIDYIEMQERLSVHMVGGFGCVYGDGSELEFDLCQSCLLKLVDSFARINGDTK